jgi:hypothetical protein
MAIRVPASLRKTAWTKPRPPADTGEVEATASQRCLDAYQNILGEQRRESTTAGDDSVEHKQTIEVIGRPSNAGSARFRVLREVP